MAIDTSSKMLTTSGVAKLLHLHINTVRRWSDEGILKPYRVGPRGDRRFLRDDIIHFLTTQQYRKTLQEMELQDIKNKVEN